MHRNAAQFVVKKLIKPSKSRPKACRVGPASFSLPSGCNVGSGRFEPVLLFGPNMHFCVPGTDVRRHHRRGHVSKWRTTDCCGPSGQARTLRALVCCAVGDVWSAGKAWVMGLRGSTLVPEMPSMGSSYCYSIWISLNNDDVGKILIWPI